MESDEQENRHDYASKEPKDDALGTPIKRNEDRERENNEEDRANKVASFDKPKHWTEYVEAFAAIALIVITGFYTNFARGQLGAMNSQLAQMEGAGRQTDQLICLYRQQVSKLGEQIAKLDGSIAATNRLGDQAKRSADTAQQVLKEAKRQTEISHDQLVYSERPWIQVDASVVAPLTFDENVGHTVVSYSFYNAGNSPATDIGVIAWFIPLDRNKPNQLKDIKNGGCKNGGIIGPSILFKNTTQKVQVDAVMFSPDIKAALFEPAAGAGTRIDAYVIGCVGYRSELDPKLHFGTGFAYELGELDPAKHTYRYIDPSVPSTPAVNLNLIPHPDLDYAY